MSIRSKSYISVNKTGALPCEGLAATKHIKILIFLFQRPHFQASFPPVTFTFYEFKTVC